MNRRLIPILLSCSLAATVAVDHTPTTARPAVASVSHATSIPVTMRALAKLRSYGYTWTSDQGADRAIRHWQKANGLTVDGLVGPETSASLGLDSQSVTVSRPAAVAGSGVVPSPATATVPAARVDPPQGSVEDAIRNAWPDDLEDHAIAIATRESHLQPAVINRNHNATGLFQIMWTVHRSWLCPQLGICAQSQLQDANLNSQAAYALYLRDGGWGPWSL